jgi:hypothetical protein
VSKLKPFSHTLTYEAQYSDGLQAGQTRFDSQHGQEVFIFSTMSRLALGPTQSPIQWVPEALSPGVKRQMRETDHLDSSSPEAKIGGTISLLPYTSSWNGF